LRETLRGSLRERGWLSSDRVADAFAHAEATNMDAFVGHIV